MGATLCLPCVTRNGVCQYAVETQQNTQKVEKLGYWCDLVNVVPYSSSDAVSNAGELVGETTFGIEIFYSREQNVLLIQIRTQFQPHRTEACMREQLGWQYEIGVVSRLQVLTTEPGYQRVDEEIQSSQSIRYFAVEGTMVWDSEEDARAAGTFPIGEAYSCELSQICEKEQRLGRVLKREDLYSELRANERGMYSTVGSLGYRSQYGDASNTLIGDRSRIERRMKREQRWKSRQAHIAMPVNGTGLLWPVLKFVCSKRSVPLVGFVTTCFVGDNIAVASRVAVLVYRFFCAVRKVQPVLTDNDFTLPNTVLRVYG